MTTSLADLLRYLLRLLLATGLLALAACGPGTGGTGTGPVTGVASFSGMVGTTFGAGISIGLPCSDDCPSVSLRVENERIELDAPCGRFVHLGPWSIDGSGTAVLQGNLDTTSVVGNQSSVSNVPASMRLVFSEGLVDSRQVMLTVRDDTGRNLLTPLTLKRDADPPAVGTGSCTNPP